MSFYTLSLFGTSAASFLLALFVFFKGRKKILNISLALLSLSVMLWTFAQAMGEILEAKDLILLWTRIGIAVAVFIPVFFLHFISSLIGKFKRLLYFVYAAAFVFLIFDFTPLFIVDIGPALGFRYYPKPGIIYHFFTVFVFVCFVFGFLRLFWAYRNAIGAAKNKLLYVIFACLIGFLGGVTAFFPVWNINFPVLSYGALPLWLLIMVYAIIKHRLLDISIIIREGLVYSTLTLLFAGFYALAVLFANYLFSNLVQFNPILAVLIVVFISVLVFQPLRDKVQDLFDRLFFKGEYRYQKKIEDLSAENRKLFRSLLKADKLAALGTLSAGMAHEIKNPLASIKGLTQVLEEKKNDPLFFKKYQEIVCRQIDRINGLVEKLLRIGGPQELLLKKLDLNQVLNEVLNLIENQCQTKNISLVINLGELPEIKGDHDQLSQVFMNLLLNAIQAMPGCGKLSVRSYSSIDNIYVEITDSGVGIPSDRIDKIFDPFFSTKHDGTGMGLAVAYRIVKEHQGEINVESQVGKGTRFILWLPIKHEQ